MADDVFPKTSMGKGIFVKTYSKVRPLQNFVKSKASGSRTPATFHPGKPFPFIIPPANIAPTLAPNNSPSSDSSSSESQDVEMICSEVDKPANTEEEDERSFVTLTPRSKMSRKKQNTKNSYNPLKNISNVIKGMRSGKTESQNRSPLMWTCTKVRPHDQLACIQESDQESSSNDSPESEAHPGTKSKAAPKEKKRRGPTVAEDQGVKTQTHQDKRRGRKAHHWQNQQLVKHSPMIIQGRGVFSSSQGMTLDNEKSTKLYGSIADPNEPSTVTYTRESEDTSEESTFATSDVSTGSCSTTASDTLMEEDYSDIEIPRDIPEPKSAKRMKQLTPKVAQIFFPDEISSARTTPRRSEVFTTKALPRKYSSTRHDKKTTVTKNSTLMEDLLALNIQEYRPVGEISEIKEICERNPVPLKTTSTPNNSKDRNTVVHQRFNADVSSIDGDACAMPTIDVIQSADTPILADNAQASTDQKPIAGVEQGSTAPKDDHAPRSVHEVSAKPGTSTPLSIKGRKALTQKRTSPRMSPRVAFSHYPTAATKSTSKNTSITLSRNIPGSVSGSAGKHVKFLLSNRDHEVLPDPDSDAAISVVHLPDLSPSSSILKKRDNTNAESVTPVLSKTDDAVRSTSLAKESKKTGRHRMTSTPQRRSRRTKGAHMLELSFDVSAVNLPSSRDDDLITIHPSGQTKPKTIVKVTTQDVAPVTVVGQSTQEPMDVEPIPVQVPEPVINVDKTQPVQPTQSQTSTHGVPETQHPLQVAQTTGAQDAQTTGAQDAQHSKPTESQTSTQVAQKSQHPVQTNEEPNIQATSSNTPNVQIDKKEHTTPDPDMEVETQSPDHGTPDLYSPQNSDLQTPTTKDQRTIQDKRQQPVHATPRAQLKRSSPSSDLPGRPSKKKFTEKGKSAQVNAPPSCDRATQKDLPRQKRLEYADKAVGPPECIISRITATPIKPAKFWQCVHKTGPLDYDSIRNLPRDIFETIPDAVFS